MSDSASPKSKKERKPDNSKVKSWRRLLYPLAYLVWILVVWIPNQVDFVENRLRRNFIKLQMRLDPPPKRKRRESYEDWLERIERRHAVRYVSLLDLMLTHSDESYIEEQARSFDDKDRKEVATLVAKGIGDIRALHDHTFRSVMAKKH